MSHLTHISPEFVEFIPNQLEQGVLYISEEFGVATHLCACGCGGKVVTPLSPAQWHLIVEDESVSLKPSVGSGSLPCNSHYWITNSEIRWSRPLTEQQTRRSQQRDREVVQRYYAAQQRTPRWRLLRRWKRRRRSKS